MKKLAFTIPALAASPAFASETGFFSFRNAEFVVVVGFLLFVGVLVYFKIPKILGDLLDKRAESIRADLNEAKALREEAQTILASYERKQKEVQAEAEEIVKAARTEAELGAEVAKQQLKESIARRLQAAEEQIASAQAAAVREVRDQAATVAVSAAREVIAKQMTADKANKLIEAGIKEVSAKLH